MNLILPIMVAFAVQSGAGRSGDELVVITNRSAPVERLDSQKTTQIFLKQIQTWPDGKPITPVDVAEGSPLRAEFYAKVTGRSVGQIRAYWARQEFTGMGFRPRQAASAADVARVVQATPGAIGYVSRKAATPAVKVVLDVSH